LRGAGSRPLTPAPNGVERSDKQYNEFD